MSEAVMFQQAPSTDAPPLRIGLTATQGLGSLDFVREEAVERFAEPDAAVTYVDARNTGRRGVGVYFAGYDGDGGALAGTVGYGILGLDFTARLWRRNYVTMAGTVYGGWQLYLQHRAIDGPVLGTAVGLGYRHAYHYFDVENLYVDDVPGAGRIAPSDVIGVHELGARVTVLARPRREAVVALRGNLFVGWMPEYGRPMVSAGISLGGF